MNRNDPAQLAKQDNLIKTFSIQQYILHYPMISKVKSKGSEWAVHAPLGFHCICPEDTFSHGWTEIVWPEGFMNTKYSKSVYNK